jgi:prepilin signal peptidase PulO-like enzyme (type II secretory pathway)
MVTLAASTSPIAFWLSAMYLWQKGKCRSCETSFAPQHLYVELMSGIMFFFIFLHVFNSYEVLSGMFIAEIFFMFVFFSLAIILMIFDYEHMIVPNALVYPMLGMALIGHTLGFMSLPQISLTESAIAALVLALPLFLFWFVSKGRWMGGADSKIGLVMGAFLGFSMGISAWVFSFWIGAGISILLVLLAGRIRSSGKPVTLKSAIPFGPFLILALWFVYVSGISLFIL